MPSTSEEGFADYVLWGDDSKPLADIEAKRTKRRISKAANRAAAHKVSDNVRHPEDGNSGQVRDAYLSAGVQWALVEWKSVGRIAYPLPRSAAPLFADNLKRPHG